MCAGARGARRFPTYDPYPTRPTRLLPSSLAASQSGRTGTVLAVTLAHDVLYYVAPNARVRFRWITPGGLAATLLVLASSAALSLYVSSVGRYDQVYGQAGAVVVLMLWLYVTGLAVLLGAEANAVLARMAEERKGAKLVDPGVPGRPLR